MPRRRTVAALLAAALAGGALPVAGCGDGGDVEAKNAYVDAANRSVTRFEDAYARLQADFNAASTPTRDRTTLGRLAAAAATTARELGAVRPPAEVADLHRRLVALVGRYREVVDRARAGLASDDLAVVQGARTTFSTDLASVTEQIGRTIQQINRVLRG